MTKTVQIAFNPTVAKIVNPDKTIRTIVQELLTFTVAGAEFMGFGSRWDGKSSFFTWGTAKFPAGFVHLVSTSLRQHGFKVQLIRKPLPEPLGPESPVVDGFGNDNPDYDYQMRALRQVEKHGRGIIQIATGGGKSKIARLIAARYRRITLFITTRGVLMHQMADDLNEHKARHKLPVGIVGDGEFRPVRGFNCCMVQTLIAKLEEPDLDGEMRAQVAANERRPQTERLSRDRMAEIARAKFQEKTRERARIIKFLEMIEVVIGEEAHEAGGNSYFEILRHCKNAHIRVALTATPFMKESAEDNMRLMAAFGPILIKVSEKMLIDRGILATPIFKFHMSKPHPKLRKHSPWQRAYQLGYAENDNMVSDIVNDALKARDYGLPVLSLILRKAHGERVFKAMKAAGARVEYLRGENDQAERKRQLRRLAAGELDAVVGTTILDVGVDVPAVGLVQLAGGGKAEVTLRQRIGRGLRRKSNMPNYCFIIDYTTEPNQHLQDHARTRRRIIEQTEGFGENILPPGVDLPWKIFEKNKRAA